MQAYEVLGPPEAGEGDGWDAATRVFPDSVLDEILAEQRTRRRAKRKRRESGAAGSEDEENEENEENEEDEDTMGGGGEEEGEWGRRGAESCD